ncbi:hypothetical protein KCP69_05945 [Salmonella enterica subsp. enterica]|nr:hypothetical protein KCP69_05945 [Salmonella enterica subsp. enterica]
MNNLPRRFLAAIAVSDADRNIFIAVTATRAVCTAFQQKIFFRECDDKESDLLSRYAHVRSRIVDTSEMSVQFSAEMLRTRLLGKRERELRRWYLSPSALVSRLMRD